MGLPALCHECAFATSRRVVRVFAPLLREEELVDALNEVYPLVKDALFHFARRLEAERRRLHGPPAPDAETGRPSREEEG